MTPVAVKNWLMEEHRSAIWAASRDQLLSSACLMLSFRPADTAVAGETGDTWRPNYSKGHCRYQFPHFINLHLLLLSPNSEAHVYKHNNVRKSGDADARTLARSPSDAAARRTHRRYPLHLESVRQEPDLKKPEQSCNNYSNRFQMLTDGLVISNPRQTHPPSLRTHPCVSARVAGGSPRALRWSSRGRRPV